MLSLTVASAQYLYRRAFLGVTSAALTDSLRTVSAYRTGGGVFVTETGRNGTAQSAGLQEGDIIIRINGYPVESPQQLNQYMTGVHTGERIVIEFFRDGEEKTATVDALPWPEPEFYDNRYLEIPFDSGYLRAVLSIPRDAVNPPVIYFVQGIGCGSIYYLPPHHPYKRIPEQFINEGFAVFFIEKPGAGDSRGTAVCAETGFDYEQRAFDAGYGFLKTLDGIDTGEIYIFGHSFGGIHAPILAEKFQPAGVIAYGTGHRAWMDYLIELRRYQGVWMGGDFPDVNSSMHDLRRTYYELFYNKKTLEELFSEEPYRTVLGEQLGYQSGSNALFGRHYSFHVEANLLNLDLHWKNTRSRVLAIYGTADIEALFPYDHERIVEVVNHYRPGSATFWLYPETDHALVKVGTLAEGWKIRSEGRYAQAMRDLYNEQVIRDVVDWIREPK